MNDADAGIEYARTELGCPASGWRVELRDGAYWAHSPTQEQDGLVIFGRDAQELVARVRVNIRVIAIAMDRQGRLAPGGVLCGVAFMEPPPARLVTDPHLDGRGPIVVVPPAGTFSVGGHLIPPGELVRIPQGNPPPPGWVPRSSPTQGQQLVTVHTRVPVEQVQAAVRQARTFTHNPGGRERGYEGDACENCHAMTMVRNGACLKCDSCGQTTGCS